MPTRILLVRHGATQLTADDRFAGSSDTELSAAGRQQVERLAERLRGVPLAAAYASPARRTIETARILASPHGIDVVAESRLREIAYGHWEGHTRDEVRTLFAKEYMRWEEDPLAHAPQGGDSGMDVLKRALPALRSIVRRHPDQTVLVVSHKGTNRLLISALLGLDPRSYRKRLNQEPAALNVLDFADAAGPQLRLLNDTAHYARCPL